MKITLGFSPCPNDTFIFDALVNQKIDTGDYRFSVQLEDVETLNEMAKKRQLDFTKISYGVLPVVTENYRVLNSGSALGNGVGPLLISNREISFDEVPDYTIAIPGDNTTAHLLFSLAFPTAQKKIFKRYDLIENTVRDSDNILGVIIHENRFTYMDRGFCKIVDLGNYWETKTGLPIPLGGIAGSRHLPQNVLHEVDRLIRKSIEYAFERYPHITGYVREHSQEMSPEVMKKHIDLYVNKFSIDLGTAGKNAVMEFIKIYDRMRGNKSSKVENDIFV